MPQSLITIKSCAKINLYLKVIKKRTDGYHEVRTGLVPLELHDTITLQKTTDKITISCDDKSVPADKSNLAYKAAMLFLENTSINTGLNITIQKNIPVAAGLGGGSSNAAATLVGLNEMFDSPLSKEKLIAISSKIGADVPFFIDCKPVHASGIGDIFVSPLNLPELHILLINPLFGVSAAWAYNNLALKGRDEAVGERHTFAQLNKAKDVAAILKNSLEEPVAKKYPVIDKMKKELANTGCIGALMSGSGPTVFGIYDDHDAAASAMQKIRSAMPDFLVILTKNKLDG
jgi:4-diphosphocytidyl-2-C-methyl-D-erythritol kinase